MINNNTLSPTYIFQLETVSSIITTLECYLKTGPLLIPPFVVGPDGAL